MTIIRRACLLILTLVALGGCDTFFGKELSLRNGVVSGEGVRSMVTGKDFLEIGSNEAVEINVDTIVKEVAPGILQARTQTDSKGKLIDTPFADLDINGKKLRQVAIARDLIQDRIIAASVQRCNLYKRFIQRVGTQTNLILGTLATIAGGAGAIVTGADTARALAGTSGILGGARAEFNDAYFKGLAIHVVVKGIDERRKEILKEIDQRRVTKPKDKKSDPVSITRYSAAQAIRDALEYHGACTIMVGLQEANDKIEKATNPGIKELEAHVIQFERTRTKIDKEIKKLRENGS